MMRNESVPFFQASDFNLLCVGFLHPNPLLTYFLKKKYEWCFNNRDLQTFSQMLIFQQMVQNIGEDNN